MLGKNSDLTKIDTQRVTLREQVLKSLRLAILQFKLMPGERLIERDLCDMLGVSRTSIREALRHLESEGLVEYLANKGPIVTRLTLKTAREIYELRASLECLIVQLYIINATNQQLQMLQTVQHLLTRRLEQGELASILDSVNDLYHLLCEGSGNLTAARLLNQQQARINLLRATSISQENRCKESLAEMHAMIEAIKQRDPHAAYETCAHHVRRASEVALTTLAKQEGLSEVPEIFIYHTNNRYSVV